MPLKHSRTQTLQRSYTHHSFDYNEKDNISAIVQFDEEGIFISREEIKYDEKGSLAERCKYDADKKIISRITLIGKIPN